MISMYDLRQSFLGVLVFVCLAWNFNDYAFGAQTDWQKDWEQTSRPHGKKDRSLYIFTAMNGCLAISKRNFPASTSCPLPGAATN